MLLRIFWLRREHGILKDAWYRQEPNLVQP